MSAQLSDVNATAADANTTCSVRKPTGDEISIECKDLDSWWFPKDTRRYLSTVYTIIVLSQINANVALLTVVLSVAHYHLIHIRVNGDRVW